MTTALLHSTSKQGRTPNPRAGARHLEALSLPADFWERLQPAERARALRPLVALALVARQTGVNFSAFTVRHLRALTANFERYRPSRVKGAFAKGSGEWALPGVQDRDALLAALVQRARPVMWAPTQRDSPQEALDHHKVDQITSLLREYLEVLDDTTGRAKLIQGFSEQTAQQVAGLTHRLDEEGPQGISEGSASGRIAEASNNLTAVLTFLDVARLITPQGGEVALEEGRRSIGAEAKKLEELAGRFAHGFVETRWGQVDEFDTVLSGANRAGPDHSLRPRMRAS